ncbi:MAG: dienelactone hydrolase family protein [Gemmatimonadaceae bacterium]
MMHPRSSWITVAADDGTEMNAYVTYPQGDGQHPGILVLQEAMGVNSQLRGVADRFAALGFVAIAPDLFHRVSPGYNASTLEWDIVRPFISALTIDGMVSDVRAAHAWMVSQTNVDAQKTAAIGFCMGGRATYLANSVLPLSAAISYYGGSIAPNLLDRASSLRGPHLFFWGGKDTSIAPEQHRAVADALRQAGKSFVDVEFSECNHGFFNEQWVERYNADAARQSWAIGVTFLQDAFGVSLRT